jgi:hypothetical protein
MELLLFVAWMLGSLFVAVIGLVATERFSRFLLWGGVALVFSPPLALGDPGAARGRQRRRAVMAARWSERTNENKGSKPSTRQGTSTQGGSQP